MGSQGVAGPIAERVRHARETAGLTAQQLAKTTGIPATTLDRRIDTAPERFTVQELEAIAIATSTELIWLITGAHSTEALAS